MVAVIQKDPPQFYPQMDTEIVIITIHTLEAHVFKHLMLVKSFYENGLSLGQILTYINHVYLRTS